MIADDVVPRSGSEAGLGPTVAAIVGVYTVMALGLVVLVDRAFQTIAAFISRYRSRG